MQSAICSTGGDSCLQNIVKTLKDINMVNANMTENERAAWEMTRENKAAGDPTDATLMYKNTLAQLEQDNMPSQNAPMQVAGINPVPTPTAASPDMDQFYRKIENETALQEGKFFEQKRMQDALAAKKVAANGQAQGGLLSNIGDGLSGAYDGAKGMLSGLRTGANKLFNDPARMALLQGGLTAMNPNSYYDQQGFYSPMEGLSKAMGQAGKTFQSTGLPRKLGFKEEEQIKHKNKMAEEKAKASYLIPKTAKDANKRQRFTSGPKTGELVFDIEVAPDQMDKNQIINAELKFRKDFANDTALERDQMSAYRRIEAIYDDPSQAPVFDDSGPVREVQSTDGVKVSMFELSKAGAADLALIFNYMKMLDPGSVVRESEFALAAQTGGLTARVSAYWDKIVKGGTLDESMRRDLVGQSRNQFNSAVNNITKKYNVVLGQMEEYKDFGLKADRAIKLRTYSPMIDESNFLDPNPVKKVDPNNRLGLDPKYTRKGR